MEPDRRDFLRLAGAAGIGVAGSGGVRSLAHAQAVDRAANTVTLDHAEAKLEDGGTLRIPFWRIESGVAGPSLLALAAQHGNEVQGVEVVRRLKEVCARQLIAGSVWLVPMANLPAIRVRRHSVDLGPEQPNKFSKGHNMQNAWPGNPEGNDTERLAYALDRAVVRHCSHAVDIHCWNHFLAAETLSTRGHAPSELLSSAGSSSSSRANTRCRNGKSSSGSRA
jgi:predicted deacylase